MEIIKPYNPLDKKNLGVSVAEAMLEQPVSALPPERFIGAGIYALYYKGDFPPYKRVSEANQNGEYGQPIYIGKAIPEGARKGGLGLDAPAGFVLQKRLVEHAKSIEQVSNLNLSDFACRFLVVDDIWIPLGESLLIESFRPLWNMVVDGFGNHTPGEGRFNQRRSSWDELHPGRSWALRCQPGKAEIEIIKSINEYLNT
ncbi:MAG: Eco29kI family restriction endonuclease [Pyrinomonadaceae bacterium]